MNEFDKNVEWWTTNFRAQRGEVYRQLNLKRIYDEVEQIISGNSDYIGHAVVIRALEDLD